MEEDCLITPALTNFREYFFLFSTWIFKEKTKLPCISKWCRWQAEIMAWTLSARKGLQFPTEFIVEQNEKKIDRFN